MKPLYTYGLRDAYIAQVMGETMGKLVAAEIAAERSKDSNDSKEENK
jgi:hypothetical protein